MTAIPTLSAFTLLDPKAADWSDRVRAVGEQLAPPDRPLFFPPHFLQAVFPKLGGLAVYWPNPEDWTLYGLLFPRELRHGRRHYTLRLHPRTPAARLTSEQVVQAAQAVAERLGNTDVYGYDPMADHLFAPTIEQIGPLSYGRPDRERAVQMRQLQAEVWGVGEDSLYPPDLHSVDFCPATSLVAWDGSGVAGALFGFYQFSADPLPALWQESYQTAFRIESQSLGVSPAYRGQDIAFTLKRLQSQDALAQGIHVINWVTDPLQLPNARLNFGHLRAVAGQFFPDYLPFRNQLNRLPASRLRVTLLPGSAPTQHVFNHGSRMGMVNLTGDAQIVRVNQGWEAPRYHVDAPCIALEIPANWTQLQNQNLAVSQQWRETTDSLFAHYLGWQTGGYVVTGVGADGERRFLLAERADHALAQRYLPAAVRVG